MSNLGEYRKYFNDSKYTNCYFNIIEKAKTENRVKRKRDHPDYSYYEKHHIVPKCIEKLLIKDKNNLVLLTAKEHILCHSLLCKMGHNTFFRKKLEKAYIGMIRSQGNLERNLSIYQATKARQLCSINFIGPKEYTESPLWFNISKDLEIFRNFLYTKISVEFLDDQEIGNLFGLHRSTIRKWRKKFNLKSARDYLKDDKWLREQYIDKKLSANEIAKLLRVAPITIRRRLHNYEISVRSLKEARENYCNRSKHEIPNSRNSSHSASP